MKLKLTTIKKFSKKEYIRIYLTILYLINFSFAQITTIEWQKTGGTASDLLLNVAITNDDGSILGWFSKSGISGNKQSPNKGDHDYWIIKTDFMFE